MDVAEFLGLSPDRDLNRWVLPVTRGICSGTGRLFGGCGLAAGIAAMESVTGRRTMWATAQYLSQSEPPDLMDLDVIVAARGRSTTQARVVAHVVEREILTVNAALGARDYERSGQWAEMPEVPPPGDCPVRKTRSETTGTLSGRIQVRIANGRDADELDGTPGTGRCALWARLPETLDMSAAALAVLGDYAGIGVGQAFGELTAGTSLDNTVRVVRLVETDWVLLDIRMHAVFEGVAHCLAHLWAADGTLLATASQSCTVRALRIP